MYVKPKVFRLRMRTHYRDRQKSHCVLKYFDSSSSGSSDDSAPSPNRSYTLLVINDSTPTYPKRDTLIESERAGSIVDSTNSKSRARNFFLSRWKIFNLEREESTMPILENNLVKRETSGASSVDINRHK